MRISVVIPTYNRAKFLKEAVESVGAELLILGALGGPLNRQLDEFCRAHDIALVPLEFPPPYQQWIFSRSDVHYTAPAAELVADQIEPHFRKLFDLPRTPKTEVNPLLRANP